jgi:hypothetical protein
LELVLGILVGLQVVEAVVVLQTVTTVQMAVRVVVEMVTLPQQQVVSLLVAVVMELTALAEAVEAVEIMVPVEMEETGQ